MQSPGTSAIYYKHSGRVEAVGLLTMPLLGGIAAAALGAAYGYWIYYFPVVYVNGVFPVLFGAGVGAAVATGARLGKTRSTAVVVLIAAMVGVLAEYVGWVSWIHAVSRGAVVLAPTALWDAAREVAKQGAWSVFGWAPSGTILYAIWALEGAVVVGASTAVAGNWNRSLPFCERCTCWTAPHAPLPRISSTGAPDALCLQLEQGNLDSLADLGKAPSGATEFTELALYSCPKCRELNVLKVMSVALSTDDDGKESRTEMTIVDGLLLDSSAAAAISAL